MMKALRFIKTIWKGLCHDPARLRKVIRDRWRKFLIGCGARTHVRALWPLAILRPYRRARLKLWSSGKGVGDEVLCTIVFDAIKRANPACQLTFVTRYPVLFEGHPSLDQVLPDSLESREGCITLTYGHCIPPPRPLGSLMAECVGLLLPRAFAPSLPNVLVAEPFKAQIAQLGRPLVVVQPRPSRWTPNKDWPLERWNVLVQRLAGRVKVVECGTEPVLDASRDLISYAGKTSLAEFAYLVSVADVFIGPPSGGMNLAAAYRTLSVILFGGYESPHGYQYETVTPLYRQISCAPCWLTTKCPHQLECLHQITVEDVLAAVDKALEKC